MGDLRNLEDAQVLLLAVHLISEGQKLDEVRLLALTRADVLRPEIIYRLLLSYAPQDTPAQDLVRLLQGAEGTSGEIACDADSIDTSSVDRLSSKDAQNRVKKLRLPVLPKSKHAPESDLLSRFLLARAYQSDSSGDDLLPLVRTLVPFLEHCQPLREWFVSQLLPLLRLRYEYYPDDNVRLLLRDLDTLHGRAGVGMLLEYANKDVHKSGVARDLRSVVGPVIYGGATKRRKLNEEAAQEEENQILGWQDVNEWLLATSLEDFNVAETAIISWDGPRDIDLGGFETYKPTATDKEDKMRYCQTALAAVYAAGTLSEAAVTKSRNILRRVSELSGIQISSPSERQAVELSQSFLQISRAALFQNALLYHDNQLTLPSTQSMDFLEALLESISRLQYFRVNLPITEAAVLSLLASEEQQLQELRRFLQRIPESSGPKIDWASVRTQFLWLQSWTSSSRPPTRPKIGHEGRALLWRLTPQVIEAEVLRSMLAANAHGPAAMLYAAGQMALSAEDVQQIVEDSIYQAYDNASNGNRTRGGMLRAYQMMKTFQPLFPQSQSFRKIEKLIAATHGLSFYHLTLQHGVPFQPVSIRLQKDPLSLIERVLEQNQKAYTKLDDLLSIGRDLAAAGLPIPRTHGAQLNTTEARVLDAEHRATYLAIQSALASHDFDTAYSYITTRLSSRDPSAAPGGFIDDTSWRAAYAAGTYSPPESETRSLQFQLRNISRRMELLSQALMLAPDPESLPEILDAWRSCEDEMDSIKAEDVAQARDFENQAGNGLGFNSTSVVPGSFAGDVEDREGDIAETARMVDSRRTGSKKSVGWENEEEGPMSLFDLARGAANTLQRSARSALDSGGSVSQGSTDGRTAEALARPRSAASERLRKRDMLGNMVTDGLVSGMSWVLGAPSTSQAGRQRTAPEGQEE